MEAEAEASEEDQNMSNDNNNNNKPNKESLSEYRFRLFSYLSVAVMSVVIILIFSTIIQHNNEDETREQVLQNQILIKNITSTNKDIGETNKILLKNIEEHEMEEMVVLESHKNISKENGQKLDQILELLTPRLDGYP